MPNKLIQPHGGKLLNLYCNSKDVESFKDDAVNLKESKELHKLCNTSQLKIIEEANHVFNAKHPWDNSNLPEALNIVVKYTAEFIKQKSLT